MFDAKDAHVELEAKGTAACPYPECKVVIVDKRDWGAGESDETVGGFVKHRVIEALSEHYGMAHGV